VGSEQEQARAQQRVDDLCGAAIRALTGDPDLHLRARTLYRGQQRIAFHAPHLRTDPARDELADHRGAADGMALRLSLCDPAVHRVYCPADPIERLLFELLEQLRVESLAPTHRPGMARNLTHRFTAWSLHYYHAGLADSEVGLLLYAVAQMAWARVNSRAVLQETEDLLEPTRAGIAPIVGKELAALKRHRRDQASYAQAALRIARRVRELIEDARLGLADRAAAKPLDEELAALQWFVRFDAAEDEAVATVATGRSEAFEATGSRYRVFTDRYDHEAEAAGLLRPAHLRELRERLDERLREQAINRPRLVRRLAALFARPVRDDWVFGEEEGHVDGRRLAQLISSPAERAVFQRERYESRPDAVVGFLIDCSGSMKQHAEAVALLVETLTRALERLGVPTEVLGFTTRAWNGGRAQADWISAGRPRHPGRLNELLHLVFKSADTPWPRARPALAALLKVDLYREGVDGEAVDWACARLAGREQARRVLVVISDGCPMDTATNLANDAFYLDNHLKNVLAGHERRGEVEVYGLGVGLDLSPYYPRCLALDLAEGLSNQLLDEVVQLLAGRRRR
jgi:cobaltochelatase CobT